MLNINWYVLPDSALETRDMTVKFLLSLLAFVR
jgi:hypothetical protein